MRLKRVLSRVSQPTIIFGLGIISQIAASETQSRRLAPADLSRRNPSPRPESWLAGRRAMAPAKCGPSRSRTWQPVQRFSKTCLPAQRRPGVRGRTECALGRRRRHCRVESYFAFNLLRRLVNVPVEHYDGTGRPEIRKRFGTGRRIQPRRRVFRQVLSSLLFDRHALRRCKLRAMRMIPACRRINR